MVAGCGKKRKKDRGRLEVYMCDDVRRIEVKVRQGEGKNEREGGRDGAVERERERAER